MEDVEIPTIELLTSSGCVVDIHPSNITPLPQDICEPKPFNPACKIDREANEPLLIHLTDHEGTVIEVLYGITAFIIIPARPDSPEDNGIMDYFLVLDDPDGNSEERQSEAGHFGNDHNSIIIRERTWKLLRVDSSVEFLDELREHDEYICNRYGYYVEPERNVRLKHDVSINLLG